MKITGYTYHKHEDGFAELRFVLKALSTDPTREVLSMLCVRDGQFIATDRRRLHVTDKAEGHEDGLYTVLANTAKLIVLGKAEYDGKYPNTKQVIPTSSDHTASAATPEMLQHCVSKDGGGCLNHQYLLDTIPKGEFVTVAFTDELSPYLISHAKGFAVLMPIRGDA